MTSRLRLHIVLKNHRKNADKVIAAQVEQRSVPTESVTIGYALGNGTQAMIDTSPIGPLWQSYRNSNHQITGGIKGDW